MTDKTKQSFEYLKEAYRSFGKKEFANAVVILERACESGPEDSYTFFLLALSLLYENNFSRAEYVLSRLDRLNPDYLPFIHLRSFMELKSASTQQDAVRVYVRALEKHADDKILNRTLRRISSADNFSDLQKNAKIEDFVKITKPHIVSRQSVRSGRRVNHDLDDYSTDRDSGRKKYVFFVIFAVAFALAAGLLIYKDEAITLFGKDKPALANKIDMVTIGGSGYGLLNRVNKRRTPEFYASPDNLLSDFRKAKKLMKNGEYNRALVILNRISSSNSSYLVKEKTEFLIRFIVESDERIYEECDIKKIAGKPYLYRGYSLSVSGRAANVKASGKGTSFSLMIDYDGKNFTAVSDVFSTARASLENGDMVEVHGLYLSDMGKNKRSYISAGNISVKAKSR